MSGTDETDITYVRPGAWSASVGIPGIDEKHDFASPPRKTVADNPPSPPSQIPTSGPSPLTKAPPIHSRRWWWRKNKSTIDLDINGNNGQWEASVEEPQPNTQRPRDPRTVAIPAPRWTGTMGPILMAYMQRTSFGHMGGARRFNPNPGATFAYQPVMRQSPMSLGDGRGTTRFRPTQRAVPTSLDNQIASDSQQQSVQGNVLVTGSGIISYW